jgi:ABC-type transport system involved in multi-copper enzyme maturation permease subunit
MMGILVRKEILAHLLSYRFILTFSLFFVLVVSSVQMISLNYSRQVENYTESRRAQEEQLKEASDFRRLRRTGIQTEKSPNPLSIFATGLEREMSRSMQISSSREVKLGRSKYANPLFVLFSAPDLLYIVNIVGSLLALLFAFDSVCGEKEEGTLQLVLANAVPRHSVLLAKWIGGYSVLVLSFLFSILIAVVFAQLTTALSFTANQWSAFALMLGVAALYLAVFFALGMMISAFTHRATVSLVFNFLIWVLLVLVIPNTAPILARAVAPVPSAGVIASKREAVQRQISNEMRSGRRRDMSREQRQQQRDEMRERIDEETGKIMTAYMQKSTTKSV